MMSRPPDTLTVVLANTHRTSVAIIHEGESMPYPRRTVQVHLTAEQQRLLAPQYTGHAGGVKMYEEVVGTWLEPPAEKSA
jgi:hypothetical protein